MLNLGVKPCTESFSSVESRRAPSIVIPDHLQRGHRNASQDAYTIGNRWVETFERLGGLSAGKAVLDIGCGPGRMTIAIGDRFGWSNTYTGFEIKKTDIDFCKREIEAIHPNFQFVHLDVVNKRYNPNGKIKGEDVVFPAEDRSVDFVFATSVFTHMLRDETARYVREAARVLRPGGVFLSTWAILDDFSLAQINSGATRAKFPHKMPDGTQIYMIEDPTKSVAHPIASVDSMFLSAGLTFEHHRGAWTGARGVRGQDILIAKAP